MSQTDSKTTDDLHAMEPYEFEYFLADVWRRQGYQAEVSQQSADGGIDVVADNGKERVAIQAKRYGGGNPVGVKTIRETSNLTKRPDIDRAAVATSGEFTRSAYKEANQYDVKLYDGEELLRLDKRATGSGPSAVKTGSVLSVLGILASGIVWTLSNPDRLIEMIQTMVILFVFYILIDAFGGVFGFDLPFGI